MRFELLSAVLLFAPVCVYSQQGRGSVAGTINDPGGRALEGASVTLQSGNITAITTHRGSTRSQAWSQVRRPSRSLAGFTSLTQPFSVTAGQTARLDASLTIAANTQNVQVYAGRAGGEFEAINRTFNADNIINLLPADVFKSLSKANVADAIGRLPSATLERYEGEGEYVQVRGTEPRLTNPTIDGVNIASAETVRQVKLDIIPADLVEPVQTNETAEVNMPADGIGGSVDLRTKGAINCRARKDRRLQADHW